MTRKMQIYRCCTCGSLVEVLQRGSGGLSCCGAPLEFLGEDRLDPFGEQRLPLLDFVEVVVDAESYWQLPATVEADGGAFARRAGAPAAG